VGTSVSDPDPYFLGLLDPDPDPLVRVTDPDPDHSIIMQKSKKTLNLDSNCFMTFYDFILKNYVNVPSKSNKQNNLEKKR
jgi:hypothetical protein